MVAVVDIVHQVLQQAMAIADVLDADHRRLVDNEECAAVLVDGTDGADNPRGVGCRHVYFLVDGESLATGIARKHLGGTTGRRQKDAIDAELRQRLDEGGYK